MRFMPWLVGGKAVTLRRQCCAQRRHQMSAAAAGVGGGGSGGRGGWEGGGSGGGGASGGGGGFPLQKATVIFALAVAGASAGSVAVRTEIQAHRVFWGLCCRGAEG